ncbi:MAG: sensor signal transduction histidine kinase, partial [Nocardioides sp.]|nr:sensor signal transduction histidine kinase [Nocardioides sp.]
GVTAGAVGFAVVDATAVDYDLVSMWWGRNLTGIILIVGCARLLKEALQAAAPAVTSPHRLHRRMPRPGLRRAVETAALLLATVGCFVFAFAHNGRVLVPLLALTLWTAMRYPPLAVAAFTSATGATVIALTAAGIGPFAVIADLEDRALSMQLTVAAFAAVGLVVSGATADQRRLIDAGRRNERELRARAELYTAVAEAMEDGVVIKDAQGVVVAANAAARRLLAPVPGCPAGTDRPIMLRVDGSLLPDDEHPSAQAIRLGYAPPRDLVLHKAGLPTKVLSVSARRLLGVPVLDTPTPEPEGVAAPAREPQPPPLPCAGTGAVVVFRDVTAERAQRDELAGFAGTVAHDLRSPLTAVRGWVELSQSESQAVGHDSDLALWLGKAYDATDRMGVLIDDLLQHASSDGHQLRLADVDLNRIAAETVALHGVEDLVTVESLPEVWADETLVRQLLGNLISNAVKYVEPDAAAQVRVAGRVIGDGVELTVTDNGIGIPPGERTAVFDQFFRAHLDRAEFLGSGLGLAVCRNIVERHGGRIAVEAAPAGPGSRFVFTLPRSARKADHRLIAR